MVKKIIHILDVVLGKISTAFVNMAGILVISMVFITSYGVAVRYFFRSPEPVTNELSTILLLWGFLLAIPFVEYSDKQIKADIFAVYMPNGLQRFLNKILSPFFAVIYCTVLTWKGWVLAYDSFVTGEVSMSVWAEPLSPIKMMIPLCYAVLTLICIRNLFYGIVSCFSKDVLKDQQ